MKIQELEKLAGEGKLFVSKSLYRTYSRRIYRRDEEDEIENAKDIPYKIFSYLAWIEDMEGFWKIRKYNMKDLIAKGAKVHD